MRYRAFTQISFVFFGWALLLFVVLAFPHTTHAAAAAPWRNASFGTEYDSSDVGGVNHGAFWDRSIKASFASPTCQLWGVFGPSKQGAQDGICTNDPSKLQSLYHNSAVGVVSGSLAALYVTPPADLAYWWDDTAQSLGFAPRRVYAQGVGFSGFAALLPVWKAFRNIAYLLIAAAMIVIGFMVMMRKKIDPKTVVTVQNAIPRIVVALLLITFSYAIVGILVDVMYVAIAMAVVFFERTGLLGAPNPQSLFVADNLTTNQLLYTKGGIISAIGNTFLQWNQGTNIMDLTLRIFGFDNTFWRLANIGGILGVIFPLWFGAPGLAPFIGLPSIPVIVAFLIALAMIFLVIRLFIFFLGAYIQVIISLIFAPLQLVGEALPGSTSFESWFKNLVANLAVFPIGAVIFMLSNMFARISLLPGSLLALPYVMFGSSSVSQISALLAVGILFSIPSVAGGIRESLKAKPFVSAGPEGVVGALSQPANLIMQGYHMWTSHKTLEAMQGQRNQHTS